MTALALLLCILLALSHGAAAAPVSCRAAAAAAERHWALPANLLLAIGVVESGRPAAAGAALEPWPWSIDASGQTYALATLPEAVAVAGFLQQLGLASLDVGCFQINLHYHPGAFGSLAQGFDAQANAAYAAAFLRRLYDQDNSWPAAVAAYHSADPALGQAYLARVLQAWLRLGRTSPATPVQALPDPHVILIAAPGAAIPVYTPATLPPRLRAALGRR